MRKILLSTTAASAIVLGAMGAASAQGIGITCPPICIGGGGTNVTSTNSSGGGHGFGHAVGTVFWVSTGVKFGLIFGNAVAKPIREHREPTPCEQWNIALAPIRACLDNRKALMIARRALVIDNDPHVIEQRVFAQAQGTPWQHPLTKEYTAAYH